ncbi:MAG: LOG family protein [bacterium]
MPLKRICIFGSYKDLSPTEKQDTVRLGKLLAEQGFEIISGGFGGTMEDISQGAKSVGGKTIGVTFYRWGEPKYSGANKYIDEEIIAENLWDRIKIMLEKSDTFIIFPGGTGTLLELAAVLEHINKGLMIPKPVIAIGNFWKPVLLVLNKEPVFINHLKQKHHINHCAELVTFVDTVDAAVEVCMKLL